MKHLIALLPGDGIGPEVVEAAVRVLREFAPRIGLSLEFREAPVGGAAYDLTGHPLPAETLRLAMAARATILGAVGGPAWDELEFSKRPEQALLSLRREMGLYANLRPVKANRSLAESSPLKLPLIEDVDLLVVRELTGGVYFGEPRGVSDVDGIRRGFNTMVYDEVEVRRIAVVAFQAARKRRRLVHSVDKANVLETSRLWRQVVTEESAHFPDVTVKHLYIDNCAMQLVIKPAQFDVILTSNLFGDIISDEAAVLGGSIGLLPSASLGAGNALYEPIHGSAPDLAGKDKANPIATILSVALMLRYTFEREDGALAIERAVDEVLTAGYTTPDIHTPGKTLVGTAEMGRLIQERLLASTPPTP
jgi:3-isopropylmalate dehydrogenase